MSKSIQEWKLHEAISEITPIDIYDPWNFKKEKQHPKRVAPMKE